LAPLTSALQFEVGTWPDGQVTLSRYFTIVFTLEQFSRAPR
jgi:hypothetical protein